MFKKLLIRCATVFILVVLGVTLARQFTQDGAGMSTPKGTSRAAEVSVPPRESSLAVLRPVVSVQGQRVDPFDFLSDATPSNVVALFTGNISVNTPGKNDVVLTVNDGTRREEVTVTLYILETVDAVTYEAGSNAPPPAAADFIANADILPPGVTLTAELLTDFSDIASFEIGNYNAQLLINGAKIDATLQITDTAPPVAVSVGFSVTLGQEVTPEDFVKDITDVTPVTVTYLEGFEPDVLLPGDHLVTVVLTDAAGNTANLNAMLTVLPNTAPPRFEGLKDIEAFLGDPVMYRSGVTALDSFDNELEFEVDSEAVDITTPGDYPVKYSVTDASGNYIEEEIIIRVVNVTEESVNEMLDEVMASIITEDMTQLEKARAIFNWISANVGYVSDSPKDSVYEGAYRALRQRNGDCFVFYAIAEVMLTEAGIPNQRVTRVEGTSSKHFWNLVNADGAGWYHFDSTHNAVHSIDRFMFTDGQAFEYTDIVRRETGSRDYYTYDKTLHPEVVQ